jgi:aspartyl aminopeptidase
MREFYKVVDYLKTTLEADVNVHTITHGLRSMTDIDKKNIFPLVHLQVTSSSVDTSNITFTFEIAVVDLRNISKAPVTDKFLSNDNELDNLNTCHAVLNRLVSILRNTNNADGIDIVNAPILQPIIFEESNLLDGWRTDLELIIPNNEIVVC